MQNVFRKGPPLDPRQMNPETPEENPFEGITHPQHPPGVQEPVADRAGPVYVYREQKIQPLSRGAPKKIRDVPPGGPKNTPSVELPRGP